MHQSLLSSLVVASLATLSAPVSAQNLVTLDVAAMGFAEGVGMSPVYPAAGVLLNGYPQMPPLPPVAAFAGAATLDGTNGITWYTDGMVLAAVPHNAYAPPVPPPPPFPVPPALGIGPITGMALDPIGGLLWLTDGAALAAIAPVPPGPVVVPPFALPIPVIAPPVTGLEWDAITGTMWACDIAGNVYNFVPGPLGPVVAGPIPPPVPMPPPVAGITIDKTGAGLVYITSGGAIQEIGTGTMFPSFAGMAGGLTFHPAPNPIPVAPCACPSYPIGQTLLGPNSTGNPAFGVDIVGLPAVNPVIVAIDFAFNPLFPMINTSGCALGVTLGSPTLIAALTFSNAAGVATFPISLVGIPPGLPLYLQYGSFCPADAFGWTLSPLYQVIVSAP
ncbi:MAG: hypothetical protein NXI31_07035 [bacterium]|nr:hypothetical protein [bacterium]